MARRILRSEEFIAAIEADLSRMGATDRIDWFELLVRDIAEVERLVSVFPQAGTLVAARDGRELRKKVTRRTPFVIYYDFEPARRSSAVRLVWLVHQHARKRGRPRW